MYSSDLFPWNSVWALGGAVTEANQGTPMSLVKYVRKKNPVALSTEWYEVVSFILHSSLLLLLLMLLLVVVVLVVY